MKRWRVLCTWHQPWDAVDLSQQLFLWGGLLSGLRGDLAQKNWPTY